MERFLSIQNTSAVKPRLLSRGAHRVFDFSMKLQGEGFILEGRMKNRIIRNGKVTDELIYGKCI